MSGRYATLSPTEAAALLAKRGTQRVGPHNMSRRILHWLYCANCGLLALKNVATRAALRRPCIWQDDD